MSKRQRTLLLSGVAVVVLAALLVVVLLLPPPQTDTDKDGNTPADTSVTLIDKAGEDENDAVALSNITITYNGETYTLTADKDGALLTDRYPDLPHDSTVQKELSSELETIVADKLIAEKAETPADFGFDPEKGSNVAVSATYADGTTFAFELGNEAPSGDGIYLRETGKDAIYLYNTHSANVFMKKEFAYLSKTPITAPSAEDTDEAAADSLVIRDVELSGSVRKEKISFHIATGQLNSAGLSTSVSGFMLQRPYYRGVHSDSPLIKPVLFSALTATDITKVYPTAEDLQNYGLNAPYSACTFNLAIQRPKTATDGNGKETTTYSYYNAFEYTVKLGNLNEDGLRYTVVYAEGKMLPIVYLVDEENVDWASTQYDDLADPLLFYIYIGDVSRMSFTVNGETKVFTLTHIKGETDRDNSMIVKVGDTVYDTSEFRSLYQDVMGILRSGSTTETPKGEPVLKLKIQTNTDTVADEGITIYPHSAAKYLVRHDTGETYLVNSKNVEAFLTMYRNYIEK